MVTKAKKELSSLNASKDAALLWLNFNQATGCFKVILSIFLFSADNHWKHPSIYLDGWRLSLRVNPSRF
ncbi:MAG: hypothetical protein ACUVWQ_05660 [Candidatus Aminicenantales bacterium]